MTLVPAWLVGLAGGSAKRNVALAREARTREVDALHAHLHADETRFEETMRGRAPGETIELGQTTDGQPYRVPLGFFEGSSAWLTASTGAGKTRLAAHLVMELVRASLRGVPVSVICLDMKGGEDSLSDLTLRALASMMARGAALRDRLLARLLTIGFFANPFLVPWQILRSDSAVDPLTQAAGLAEILDAIIGRGLGARQESSLALLLAAGIDAEKNLIEVRHTLDDRGRLAELFARSRLPEVRRFAPRIARESQSSLDGLGARVDLLTRSASAKALLAGTSSIDLHACFESGAITVVDVGGAPIGAEGPAQALGAITLAYLTHAIFDSRRRVRGFTVIVTDEIQSAALSASNVHCLDRILTLGRSFGASLVSCHQSAAQLPSEIRTILSTNIAMRVLGTSGADDARISAEYLPRTGRVQKPRLPGMPPPERVEFLSATEEERVRVQELGRLPRQHFLVADRRESFQPRVVVAPRFVPPAWSTIDPALRTAVLRGRAGVPREELVRNVRALEERLLDERERGASTPDDAVDDGAVTAPRRRPRAGSTKRSSARDLPEFPDVMSPRGDRPRRGGLP